MRKAVSVTALVSSLVAGSALGAPALAARGKEEGQAMVQQVQQDEAVVEGMRGLHRRMVAEVEGLLRASQNPQDAIAQADIASTLHGQDLAAGPGGQMLIAGPAAQNPPRDPGAMLAAADAHTEKVTFLGVATERVSATLGAQLKLPNGIGLVVQYVEKGSPAADAGLKVHDIVEKFDDQWVVNQDQFTVLVRMKKPGDQATLTVLRGGERVPVKVTLTEKEVPISTEVDPGLGLPPVRPGEGGAGMLMPDFELRPGSEAAPGHGPGWTFERSSMQVSPDGSIEKKLVDDALDIDLKKTADGKTTLVVKDRTGKEIYSGPYDTPEQKAKVPEIAAAKVAALDEGVHLQSGGGAGAGLTTGSGKSALMTRTDEDHVIVLRVDAAGKKATVKDGKTGAVLFDGPVDTEDQMKALPPGVEPKLKAMEAKLGS